MPKRKFETVEEFEEHTSGATELIFDGTENPTLPDSFKNSFVA